MLISRIEMVTKNTSSARASHCGSTNFAFWQLTTLGYIAISSIVTIIMPLIGTLTPAFANPGEAYAWAAAVFAGASCLLILGQIGIAIFEVKLVAGQGEMLKRADLELARKPQLDVSIWEHYEALNFQAVLENQDTLWFVPELQINNTGSKAAFSGCFVSIWLPKKYTFVEASLQANGWSVFTMKESFNSAPGVVYWRIEQYIKEPIFLNHSVRVPTFTVQSLDGEGDTHLRWQVWDDMGQHPEGEPGTLNVGVRRMTAGPPPKSD